MGQRKKEGKMSSLPLLSLIFYLISVCGLIIVMVFEDSDAIRLLSGAALLTVLYLCTQTLRMAG